MTSLERSDSKRVRLLDLARVHAEWLISFGFDAGPPAEPKPNIRIRTSLEVGCYSLDAGSCSGLREAAVETQSLKLCFSERRKRKAGRSKSFVLIHVVQPG